MWALEPEYIGLNLDSGALLSVLLARCLASLSLGLLVYPRGIIIAPHPHLVITELVHGANNA